MSARFILFLFLGLDIVFLLLKTSDLSISYYEAALLYGDFSVLKYIVKVSLFLFGQNDFALRLPMVIMHLFSALLLYKISKKYVKQDRNRVWLVIIFVLLPGVMSSALIVNEAGLIIFGLFLFIYIYENYSDNLTYPLLIIYLFTSGGFIYLFLSLSLFSLYKKKNIFLIFNITMLLGSLFLFDFISHGTPTGHFLDAIGIYAAIFSPIIFIYIFYVLYRRYLTKDFDILWFISSVVLVLSLLLSFRQRVNLEILAPYVILALPLMAQSFEHSYRVRLNIFRKRYRLIFTITLLLLLVNSSVIFFNKYLYYFVSKPKKHFSYKMHIAKELSNKLKEKGIYCIDSELKMSQRLQFYGVTKCSNYILSQTSLIDNSPQNVTVSYKNKTVYSANVTKLNIN